MVVDATDGGCRLNKVVDALEALVALAKTKKAKRSAEPGAAVSLLTKVVDDFLSETSHLTHLGKANPRGCRRQDTERGLERIQKHC